MKKIKRLLAGTLAVLFLSVTLSSCFTQTYVVNDGAQGINKVEQRAWYALWGLVPINEVNAKSMAAGHENYTITDTFTFLDYVIGAFTGIVTIQPKTVRVTY
ncbi:MAG: Bor family protein [Bacteroidales bacterium]|nr:Bor family protein [Bacteroidales bacterium]MCF8349819.1 Bor family protein [Bacteroidales bacterium]MCF8375939.1 Bor family protein [Bacteroidales bacterium]